MTTGFQFYMLYGVLLGIALGCFLHRLKSFGLLLIIIGVTIYYGAERLNADSMSVFVVLGGAIGIRLELRLFHIIWVTFTWIRYGIFKVVSTVSKNRSNRAANKSSYSQPNPDDFWEQFRGK